VIIVTPTPPSPIKGEGYSGTGEDYLQTKRELFWKEEKIVLNNDKIIKK
jgi:hypothetical protein